MFLLNFYFYYFTFLILLENVPKLKKKKTAICESLNLYKIVFTGMIYVEIHYFFTKFR